MSRPSLSSSASDFLERKYYASEVCPGPLPDMTFLDGGVCDGMAQSTRCINSTNYELLQWPYADCSGVPAVIDTFTAPPQCADSAVETCVSDMQLTFPVRRAGFVNFYSRYGDDCAFPPAPGITYFSNILMPLDKCNRDKVLHGVAKTYSCSAAGLTVTTFEEETRSRATAPNVTVYKTGVCMPLGGAAICQLLAHHLPERSCAGGDVQGRPHWRPRRGRPRHCRGRRLPLVGAPRINVSRRRRKS